MPKEPKAKRRPSRVVIDQLNPQVDCNGFPLKRTIYEPVIVSCVFLCDGHEELTGYLRYRHTSDEKFHSQILEGMGNDVWQGSFTPDRLGSYFFTVSAWIDLYRSWGLRLLKKCEAGQDLNNEVIEGINLLTKCHKQLKADAAKKIKSLMIYLEQNSRNISLLQIKTFLNDDTLTAIMASLPDPLSYVSYEKQIEVLVEPQLAGFSSWYEFFPRSCTDDWETHGNLASCHKRLEYIADLGFDIVYLPPIHPIGKTHRKGKNNQLTAASSDVGSPWAIGSEEGGHKSIHPLLGNWTDFQNFLKKAQSLGLNVALDIAFQCSPDHPYIKEHPEWFSWRADGTIQFAENPPKKYEDIVPFDFGCESWKSLWEELRDVVLFWVEKGIRVFRVDNPHTKPIAFWQWLIAQVRSSYPEVIFLSEAFTKPSMMMRLAKIGFSQSYTYFTWRNNKQELTDYLEELTQTPLIEFFRPNFWPNTPDILTDFMSSGKRAAFIQKLILAATLSSNYGIYGPAFELIDATKRDSLSEEYQDSEKYQIRVWNLNSEFSLAPLVKRINKIRKANPALQSNRSLQFHSVNNDNIIAYSKISPHAYPVLVVVNLDPYHQHGGMIELELERFGIDEHESFQVFDLISQARYFWKGRFNYVELNPQVMGAHIFLVLKRMRNEKDFDYF